MGTIIEILLNWIFNVTYGKVSQAVKSVLASNQEESQAKKIKYITSRLKEG